MDPIKLGKKQRTSKEVIIESEPIALSRGETKFFCIADEDVSFSSKVVVDARFAKTNKAGEFEFNAGGNIVHEVRPEREELLVTVINRDESEENVSVVIKYTLFLASPEE